MNSLNSHMIDVQLLKKWFGDDLSSKSVRALRMNAELKQSEFDVQLEHLLKEEILHVVRFEYDEVGDQIPAEYGLTEESLKLISELKQPVKI